MKKKKDHIEQLSDEVFIFHKLSTSTKREVLREMVVVTFTDEICIGIAAKMGCVN